MSDLGYLAYLKLGLCKLCHVPSGFLETLCIYDLL